MPSYYGGQASGSREYTEAQAREVVALLHQHVAGRANAIRTEDFIGSYSPAGVSPRAMRAIIADQDGIAFLVAYEGGSMYLCETADDGDATTRSMQARARTELRRVARRTRYANEELDRRQMAMEMS